MPRITFGKIKSAVKFGRVKAVAKKALPRRLEATFYAKEEREARTEVRKLKRWIKQLKERRRNLLPHIEKSALSVLDREINKTLGKVLKAESNVEKIVKERNMNFPEEPRRPG